MEDGFKPTLGICFISRSLDRAAITNLLDASGISVFGCTTNGEFIDEQTEKKSAAILLMDMKTEHFQLYFEDISNKNYREVATAVAEKAKKQFKKPAFFIGLSNSHTDGEEILHGL